MKRVEVWTSRWEHADYGSAVIYWTWRSVGGGAYEPSVVAVNFDLFTPESEQQALLVLLAGTRSVREVDRSLTGDRTSAG